MLKPAEFEFNKMFSGSNGDVKNLDKVSKDAKQKVLDAALRAKECLNTEHFRVYKVQLIIAQTKIIDTMLAYTQSFFNGERTDLSKYGAQMARYMTKIEDLRILLDRVESDNRPVVVEDE